MGRWALDVVVTAGFDPRHPDPLAVACGAPQKALIDLAGRPLVWWTVRALRECPSVERIVVVGLDPSYAPELGAEVTCVPNQSDHLENVVQGMRWLLRGRASLEYGIIASGDIPLLRPETVQWFIQACQETDHDFYYSIVSEAVMEAQFPGAGRSYLRIKEGRFCGGDLFMFRPQVLEANLALARRLMEQRKNPLLQARLFGWRTLLKVALGRLSIAEGEAVASRLLRCRARVVVSPYADLAMDVDKPHQLELARRLLAERVEVRG